MLFTQAIAQLKDIYRRLIAPISINPGLLQDVFTGTLQSTRILSQPENFEETLLISSRFPGFSGGKNYSSRFPGFPGVLDTKNMCVSVTVFQKTATLFFGHNFGESTPIFTILSLRDSVGNFMLICYRPALVIALCRARLVLGSMTVCKWVYHLCIYGYRSQNHSHHAIWAVRWLAVAEVRSASACLFAYMWRPLVSVIITKMSYIVKCGIACFLCAMRVFEVRASSSSPRLPLCQILFLLLPPLLS